MIRQLRYKFIAVTMLCIGALFLLILLVINVFMTVSSRNRGYEMLRHFADEMEFSDGSGVPGQDGQGQQEIAGRDELITPPPPSNYQDAFRIFSIEYDAGKNVLEVNYNHDSDLSEEDILLIGEKADPEQEHGVVAGHYLYLSRQTENGHELFFLDYSVEHSMIFDLFILCLAAGLAGIFLLFLAVLFLSRWMIRPVEDTLEKQKQFIADASHELKTPLTIISANAEVLSSSLGENKWLAHILEQIGRMNALIRELMDLARMDAAQKALPMAPFDLSRVVATAALSFESLAYESGKTYRMDIPEGISYQGDESAIRQLVTILLDNAFKYADERGTIVISLIRKGEKRTLSVMNTGKGISSEEQKHIFERFYRSDASRSRLSGSDEQAGGYGLGLSIAASIVASHRGRIGVRSDGHSQTSIIVVL